MANVNVPLSSELSEEISLDDPRHSYNRMLKQWIKPKIDDGNSDESEEVVYDSAKISAYKGNSKVVEFITDAFWDEIMKISATTVAKEKEMAENEMDDDPNETNTADKVLMARDWYEAGLSQSASWQMFNTGIRSHKVVYSWFSFANPSTDSVNVSSSSATAAAASQPVKVNVLREVRIYSAHSLKKEAPKVHMSLQQWNLVQRMMNMDETITDSLAMSLIKLLVENPDYIAYAVPLEDYGFSWFYLYPLVPTAPDAAVNLAPTFLAGTMESEYSDASVFPVEEAPPEFRRVIPDITRDIHQKLFMMLKDDPILLKGLVQKDCIAHRLHRKRQGTTAAIVKYSQGFPNAASLQQQAGEGAA
jgi:hypothetical protein